MSLKRLISLALNTILKKNIEKRISYKPHKCVSFYQSFTVFLLFKTAVDFEVSCVEKFSTFYAGFFEDDLIFSGKITSENVESKVVEEYLVNKTL